jgi:hypothetical protein
MFPGNLTRSSITKELREVEDSIIHLLSGDDKLQPGEAGNIVNEMALHVLDKPRSAAVLPLIAQGWQGMRSLTSVILTRTLTSRTQRAGIMYMDYTAWRWLEVYITRVCADILAADLLVAHDWLTRLVLDVKTYLYSRPKDPREFQSTAYHSELTTVTYTIAPRSRLPVESTKHDDVIISSVNSILQHWLEFPTDAIAKQRACFVHAVTTEYGTNALYLDGVWEAYRALNGRAKYIGPWRVSASFKSLRRDEHYSDVHPLSDQNSTEHQMLQDLVDLLKGLGNNSHSITHSIDISNDDLSILFFKRLSPQLRKLAIKEIRTFASFITDTTNYQLRRHAPPASPKLIKIIQDRPDKFNPFRELAPSRACMRRAGGPYSEEHVRTTGGIFSAIVWRAITFGTPFAVEGPRVFTSCDDFDLKRKATGVKDKRYFCDMSAYGSCNPKRRVENARIYWQSLRDGKWEAFVGTSKIGFKECYDFFLCPKGPNLFPQLGALTAYLLTADLTYSGVVEPPTLDEICDTICDLNKGAANALRKMRLIPLKDSHGTAIKEAYRQAFKSVHATVLKLIPSEQHTPLFVDYILIEHMLCKFSRSYDRLESAQ